MQESKELSLKEIELYYDTQSILFKGDCAWPIIRFKINEELRKKKGLSSRTVKINKGILFTLTKTFFYGLKEILRLRRYSFWVFSSSDRRKKIHGKYVDRVMEPILNQYPNALAIENPYPLGRHCPKKELKNKNILSQTVFFLGIKLTSLFLKRKYKLENESELKKILEENQIILNYNLVFRNHRAQYHFMKLLLVFVKPKVVFFVYAASSMGYIKALKEKNIPVIELQHGVINELHYAYNVFKDFGRTYFPDYLLTYGRMESNVFTPNNYFIDIDRVVPVGYYYLEEFILSNVVDQNALELKNEFDKIIVLSLQDPFETYIFEFLNQVTSLDTSILYLLVPRNLDKSYEKYQLKNNVRIEKNRNIYQCLKIADFHMTINSTCAIESICFGVPNILYDYNEWASKYYGEVLNDTGHTVFVDSPKGFIDSIREHDFYPKERIAQVSRTLMERGFLGNLENFLKSKIL